MVARVLKELAATYPIEFYVVLAYLPEKNRGMDCETVFPEGLETVPKRFAISYRNKWMIERADYVITYVKYEVGSGAAQFKELAKQRGKKVIEI